MNTFPQSADDHAMFTELLQRHFDDWSLPQNNPRKWYVDDASTFDLVTPLEGYRTPDDYVPGANKGFFNKASRADFTVKEVLRVSRLSDDVVLTEILFNGSAQFKSGGEPMEMDGRQKKVWVQRDGKWFVFQEHNSTYIPATED